MTAKRKTRATDSLLEYYQSQVKQTRSTHPTHKQRCDYATQDYTVTPILFNSIAILIAHAMSETNEQPRTFLEVLTQLAVTYSLDERITTRESRKALSMRDVLMRKFATKSTRQ